MSKLDNILGEMRMLRDDIGRGRPLLLRAWTEAEGPVQVLRFTARRRERLAELRTQLVDTALANPPSGRRPFGACR